MMSEETDVTADLPTQMEELDKTFPSMAPVLLPGRSDRDCIRPAEILSPSFFFFAFFLKYKLNTKPHFDVE